MSYILDIAQIREMTVRGRESAISNFREHLLKAIKKAANSGHSELVESVHTPHKVIYDGVHELIKELEQQNYKCTFLEDKTPAGHVAHIAVKVSWI